jgi:hypothetical protein
MNIRPVALVAALLPFFAVHTTYLVAASHGLVDWCNPYFDSCTSISATGRKPPASYLFRATMLPAAVIMMAYWWLNFVWLRHLWLQHVRVHQPDLLYPGAVGRGQGQTPVLPASAHWMLWLGMAGCIGLILYVTVLGERGDAWAMQRRIGTVLFFSFTYLAQLLLAGQLLRLRGQLPQTVPRLLIAMLVLCAILLGAGLLTVILDAWDEVFYESVEDAFEWVLTLLLQSNFLLGYFTWREAGWTLEVGDDERG